jgi:predicted TIM-barrel enzyme
VNPETIILVHGGPVAEPPDADFIMKNTRHCHGFYGASSMERLPVEAAIRDQTRAFKTIGRNGGTDDNPAGTTRRSSAAQ